MGYEPMYRVWINGVGDDGWIGFPMDADGVRHLAELWEGIQGRPLTLTEGDGLIEGHDSAGELALKADTDTERLVQKTDQGITIPMGVAGALLRQATADGHPFLKAMP